MLHRVPSSRESTARLLIDSAADLDPDTTLSRHSHESASSFISLAMSEISKMRDTGNLRELPATLRVVLFRIRDSLPAGLYDFLGPDPCDRLLFLLSQPPDVSSLTFDILTSLLHFPSPSLATLLTSPPIIDCLVASLTSECDRLFTSSARLTAALSSCVADLSALFPLLARRWTPSTARATARFLYHQLPGLPRDAELFSFLRQFRSCANGDARQIFAAALQQTVAGGCPAVIAEMVAPDWREYWRAAMHARGLIGEVVQGFAVAALLLPHLDAEGFAELFDLALIVEKLGICRCHCAVLNFLAVAIGCQPSVIGDVLNDVVEILFGIAEEGQFAARERALDVFVAIVANGCSEQICALPPERFIADFVGFLGDISECEEVPQLAALIKAIDAFVVGGAADVVERVFLEVDGPEILARFGVEPTF